MITEKSTILISQLLHDFSSHSKDSIKFLLNSSPIIKYMLLKSSVRKGTASVSEVVRILCSTLELPEDYNGSFPELDFKSHHYHNKLLLS
jgi:hypothetical protein